MIFSQLFQELKIPKILIIQNLQYINNPMLKIALGIIGSILFISGFIANIWLKDSLFNYNLQIVPSMQQNSFLGSDPVIIIMNIASNLFNPIICAGYVFAMYLLLHQKFQILIFLFWFIFISTTLSFLKMFIHEPRPFWIQSADVQMREWICYTEYGCPSGHSMLGLVLIQFIIRFIQRRINLSKATIIILYILGIIVQSLVVFSRIILGMHSINQVLFGLLLGFYSIFIYYLCIENLIVRTVIKICKESNKCSTLFLSTFLLLIFAVFSLLVALWPHYENQQYSIVIVQKCGKIAQSQSFQYRCLKDSALFMSFFGIIYGLLLTPTPQNLMKTLIFKKRSRNFVIRAIVTIVLTMLPTIIFLNPLWKKIGLIIQQKAMLIWGCNCIGLLLGTLFMVGVSPRANYRLGLQIYHPHTTRQVSKQLVDNSLILDDIEFEFPERHKHQKINEISAELSQKTVEKY